MENSNWQGNPSGRKRAVDELLRGRELATRLRIVLLESREEEDAKGLVAKILNSFSNTLSILDGVESDEVSQLPAPNPRVGSPYCDSRKSEDSGESSKSSTLIKERRGCYKRRKTSESWTADYPTLVEDGYAWRKYGQKVILNAKHPRSYYRCTHKYDQGCQATKQVQRIEEEPPLYRTTYHGRHTCESKLLKGSQIIADPTDSDSSVIIRFNNATNNFASKHFGEPFSITSFPSVKQGQDKEFMPLPSDLTHHHNQSSSSTYLLSPDHFSAFDRADVISGVNSSCTASTHSLDMDVMVGAVDFDDDVLQYVEFC